MKETIPVALFAALMLHPTQFTHAQSPTNVPRIGFLTGASAGSTTIHALRDALQELGYVEGKNMLIEERRADFKFERLPYLAEQLVRLKVDVIVTTATDMSLSARRATSTIPIIMGGGGDP